MEEKGAELQRPQTTTTAKTRSTVISASASSLQCMTTNWILSDGTNANVFSV